MHSKVYACTSGKDYSLATCENLGLEFYAVIRISVITSQNCSRDSFQHGVFLRHVNGLRLTKFISESLCTGNSALRHSLSWLRHRKKQNPESQELRAAQDLRFGVTVLVLFRYVDTHPFSLRICYGDEAPQI